MSENDREPVVVAWGGGVNSTAMLCEMARRGDRPDAILFADTGGEKPATYAYMDTFRVWLERVGMPPLVVVRYSDNSKHASLEAECNTLGTMPSLAFGSRACSMKWKQGPQQKWVNHWPLAKAAWKAGRVVVQAIGIDAGEVHRAKETQDATKYRNRFPLIEWDMDRDACIAAITASSLPIPPKSACFFCPASTKLDVLDLRENHPDLYARACNMEGGAADRLDTVKGLGRRWAWATLTQDSFPLTAPHIDMPCMCFDGEPA